METTVEPKVIRSDEQYQEYLTEIQRLMSGMPIVGSADADKLELLSVLVDAYENQKYPVETPDPIDAILFRMEEQGLKQTDLVPYFGTRSRVSEVLARKRPLTVQMIRALSIGLGISTETLVGLSVPSQPQKSDSLDWGKFPIKEMVARGWVRKLTDKASDSIEELVQRFIADIGVQFGDAAFKRTLSGDAYSPGTKYALFAWLAKVIQLSREKKTGLGTFDANTLSADFLKELAQLSWFEQGPLLAVEFLERHGIAVIIEPHLKGTMLDGAALKDADGTPIVALTLRFDRLDNFWFTLMHEVAHLWKHIGADETFLDNLDAASEDRREVEANRIARDSFIPRVIWKRSDAYLKPSRESIDRLSRDLKIHPSIIAGRVHREKNNYQLFPELIGQGEVRKLFNLDVV